MLRNKCNGIVILILKQMQSWWEIDKCTTKTSKMVTFKFFYATHCIVRTWTKATAVHRCRDSLFFPPPCAALMRGIECAPWSRGAALFYCPNEQRPYARDIHSPKVVKARSRFPLWSSTVKRKKRIAWIITSAITRCM